MKVVYNFVYIDETGNRQTINLPVYTDDRKNIDRNFVYDVCHTFLKTNEVFGTPIYAISTSLDYPSYSFTGGWNSQECKHTKSEKSKNSTSFEDQCLADEKFVWAKVGENKDERLNWIPAVMRGNKVYSAIGELVEPDSEGDTRHFSDSPFSTYEILVKDDLKTDYIDGFVALIAALY